MKCLLLNYSAPACNLHYSFVNLHTPTVCCDVAATHTNTQTNPSQTERLQTRARIRSTIKSILKQTRTHMTSQMQKTMTTHIDAHVESQGLCEMTSPLKQPAAEDGLCWTKQVIAGALYALVCVCVC